ncbi:MAG: YceI family protein [Maricaulaceae bacterium]
MRLLLIAAITAFCSLPAWAGQWTLDPSVSSLSFSSIKAGDVGEAHRFTGLTGDVTETGAARVTIDLNSVETGVDIRNERMRDFLFNTAKFPNAIVTTDVDLSRFDALGVGESTAIAATATLALAGQETRIDTPLMVTRIGLDRVAVEPPELIIIDALSLGLADGVNKLRELAGLDAISLAVPTTFRFVFVETETREQI